MSIHYQCTNLISYRRTKPYYYYCLYYYLAPPSILPTATSSSRVFSRLTTTLDSFTTFSFKLKSNTTTFRCYLDYNVILEDKGLLKRALNINFTIIRLRNAIKSSGNQSLLPSLHYVIRARSKIGLLVNNKIQVYKGRTPKGIPIVTIVKTRDVVTICQIRSIFKFRVKLFISARSIY